MSIAFDSDSRIDIEGKGGTSLGVSCVVSSSSIFGSPADRIVADAISQATDAETEEVNVCSQSSSLSSSSSIGKNSDESGRSSEGEECEGEYEVQSKFKGTFDSMEDLQQVLPIRRGISKFYDGKSKSFTSLADASSSTSSQDLAKPENTYTRRRRSLLAFNHVWDKNRTFPYRNSGGGISKRTISSSRSALALAVAMNSSESIGNTSEDSNSSCNSRSPPHLPPLHPNTRASHNNMNSLQPYLSPWRSYSLADLQHCSGASTTNLCCSSVCEDGHH